MVSIGCITTPKDFAVAGTAQDKLYGMAEGLWEPDLVSLKAIEGMRP
jgi:20S proteasome subunit beta 3